MQTASVRLSYALVLFMFGVLSACAGDQASQVDEAPLRAQASIGPDRALIVSDDFESGSLTTLPWVIHGEASASPEAAHEGDFGARIATGSSITARISTEGKRDVRVSFSLRGVGLDWLEYVTVEYAINGKFYRSLGRVWSSTWTSRTLPLPATALDRPVVSLRFALHGHNFPRPHAPFEGAYLDDFMVTAAGSGMPDAGTMCRADSDCAQRDGPCVRGTCDVASGQCRSTTQPEGTTCGDGRLCDANAQCLVCGAATTTFGLVQSQIFDGTPHGCTSSVCHGRSPGAARLNLTAGTSYAQLVNVTSTLSPMLRVAPGTPDDSFLYRKIAWGTNGTPVTGGGPMPAGGAPPVPAKLLEGLGGWIRGGAPETGVVSGTVAQFCTPPCASDADCGDANACDGAERCEAGICVEGTPLRCDDGIACTSDSCDPTAGCSNVNTPGLPCANDQGTCDTAGACVCNNGSTQPDCGGDPTGQLTLRWNFPTPEAVTSTPLVVGDVVYVTAWDGVVYALDRATGTERWRHNTGSRAIQAGVARAPDGSLVVGDGEAVVWKLDPAGRVLWSRDLDVTNADHIWNTVTIHDGLIYVPISSHSDVPCTKGRTVALDLATGATVWQRMNVPANGVCRTDTSIECTTSADCPGAGACENAVGGAVTARVLVDPAGSSLYVNTVGCYTFPQVGDTDAMMRLDAKTGAVQWLVRFSENEQFNYCSVGGADCRTSADCPAGATCTAKAAFHDFGFINGPYLLDAKDAAGAARRLLVSASKSGTMYAVDPATGARIWTRAVLPPPVSPAFAGYGLFNGALAYADGKLFAALYEFVPPTSPAPPHLMAFSEVDGSTVWADEIGRSWSSLTVDRGVLYTGTQVASELYSYSAQSGTRLASFPLPATTASAPSVANDELFIGYGLSAAGGVRAYLIR